MELDVVDLGTLCALDPVGSERLPNGPCEVDELVEIFAVDGAGVMLDQKKPVATPGNVTGHRAVAGHFHFDGSRPAVAGYVFERYRAVFVQRRSYNADRRLDAVVSGLNPSQIRECGYDPDRSVPAHAEASAVIEENYPSDAVCMRRFAEQCAYRCF